MHPLPTASVADVPIPDELGHRLARLTGGGPPDTLDQLADAWGGQLRPAWRQALLTAAETPHTVEVDGQNYPVNCALDGLLLPLLADRDGTLTTTDPGTGETLSVRISPSGGHATSHPGAVLSLGVAGGSEDVHECACPHINLFAVPDAFAGWSDRHPAVATMPLTLPQALDLAARLTGDGEPVRIS
jgi:hypothetical protein